MNRRTLSERKGKNWARAATHCVHGHPFDEGNTYWNDFGWRACRRCRGEAQKRYVASQRA
jgi:uncharacterized UBP type Zn finger protein